jgi:hypothetical protein
MQLPLPPSYLQWCSNVWLDLSLLGENDHKEVAVSALLLNQLWHLLAEGGYTSR